MMERGGMERHVNNTDLQQIAKWSSPNKLLGEEVASQQTPAGSRDQHLADQKEEVRTIGGIVVASLRETNSKGQHTTTL